MNEIEQNPRRIDFEPGTYGIDYENMVDGTGRYHGVVYSRNFGPSPTCLYKTGTKTYKAESGEVDGVYVNADYLVYTLDLGDPSLIEELLKDHTSLEQVIAQRANSIKTKKIKAGDKIEVKPGILHQICGLGIVDIKVDQGYYKDQAVELNEVNLSVCLPNS